MEHEIDGDTDCNFCARYSHQRFSVGSGGLGNKRTSGDHPKYSIVEFDQNTEKSPGNLRRLAVTCHNEKPSVNASVKKSHKRKITIIFPPFTPVKDHQLTSMLIGGLSLESEWQHFTVGPQESSEYFSRSQQWCNLDGLDFFDDFQFHPFSNHFGPIPSAGTRIGITVPSYSTVFFVFCLFFEFLYFFVYFLNSFIFPVWSAGTPKSIREVGFFLLINTISSSRD